MEGEYCYKCNHTGLIPFKNKEGKIIPYAWVDCECKQPESDHYQPLKPDDFDFPCSDTWRGFYYTYCGQPDPGYIRPRTDPTIIEGRLDELEQPQAILQEELKPIGSILKATPIKPRKGVVL